MVGCVMNYHSTLAERSANIGWMINYCQEIVIDYVKGNNCVTLAEAKRAEAYLNKHGVFVTVNLDMVR